MFWRKKHSDEAARLVLLEQQMQQLMTMMQQQHHNLMVLYRRSSALASLIEAVGEGKPLRLPRAMRAEIDASLHPEQFARLAEKDPEEFRQQYGDDIYSLYRDGGLEAFSRFGDLAPPKLKVTH